MFVVIEEAIVDIDEICAVTGVNAVNLIRSIGYEFKILFKNGQHINISNNDKFALKRIHNELVAKLEQEGKNV